MNLKSMKMKKNSLEQTGKNKKKFQNKLKNVKIEKKKVN